MSEIKNTSFQDKYNEDITAAEVNAKFTDVGTATTSLDEANVRNEGIDRRNLGGTPNNKHVDFIFNNQTSGNSLYTFYTNEPPRNCTTQVALHQINHAVAPDGKYEFNYTGDPIIWAEGDLLRLHWSFAMVSSTVLYDALKGNFGTENGSALIGFPALKKTGVANFECFPDRIDFFQWGGCGPKYDTGVPIADKFEILDVDSPPPNAPVLDDGLAIYINSGLRNVGVDDTFVKPHAHLNIINNTGGDISIDKIGFFLVGPFTLNADDFGPPDRGWSCLSDGGAGWFYRFERGQAFLQILQKGDAG